MQTVHYLMADEIDGGDKQEPKIRVDDGGYEKADIGGFLGPTFL